jgi:methyl-accepting chemotaxis protein
MKLSFRTKLFIPLVSSLVALSAVMAIDTMNSRSLRLEERKLQLHNASDIAVSIAKKYGELATSGALPEEDAKKQALALVSAMRYGESGYFTAIDSNKVLMHPFKQELVGTDPAKFKDPEGTPVYLDALKITRGAGSGFSEYLWAKPGQQEPVPKLAFNSGYKPWDWTFMTGVYVDDLNDAFLKDLGRNALIFILIAAVLGTIVYRVARSVDKSIGGDPEQAKEAAQRIAAGDLSVAIATRPGDHESLFCALSKMRDELFGIVRQVRTSTETIATASSEIASGNLDLSSRTEEQASSLEETASSMEELTSTVRQNSDNANQANQLAISASEVAVRGGEAVSKVVETMGGISESSKKIADIISVIDGIAFQTNILALNAAVEAARAGEQGRGFAVVATEVRTLAQRSAAAAKEIKELIGDSTGKVEIGSKLVAQAGSTMNELVGSIARVTDIMGEITAASREQSAGIEQVNQAIAQMDQVTQQNAALVEEAAAASESMQDQATRLAQVVGVFKLDDVSTAVAALPVARSTKGEVAAPAKRPTTRKASAALTAPAKRREPRLAAKDDSGEWEQF